MIMTLTNSDRENFAELFDQMFQSRATIFHDRLRWNVEVQDGRETDIYDENEDPIYLVAVDDDNRLLGSLRLLATTGPTMLRSEFANFFDDSVDVSAPTIWECTRFCVPLPSAGNSNYAVNMTSAELLIGLCELCLSSGIEFIVGVYDVSMARVYKRIGWSPELLARSRPEIGNICVGIWEASPNVLFTMKQRLSERKRGSQPCAA